MSESETTECVEQGTKIEDNPKKRVRHRKKQLYERLLKQMEFYFSDANLSKDRFLAALVKNDPFVPLDTFLKFNKIRTITQDLTDIVKAMKHSTLLELSADKTKVSRKTPILPYDADARTIYVESIPVTASRDWLERVFSDYGHVAYISLPKFRNSQKIKGFGFIEFDKPEDAQKCLNVFTKMGCKLPTSMHPEHLSSIKTFSIEDQPTAQGVITESKEEKEEYEPPKKKNRKSKEKKLQKNLELKLTQSEPDHEKRLQTPVDENKSVISIEEARMTDVESKNEATSQDEAKTNEDTPRKKGRKKTAKERNKAKDLKEAPKGALWGLQVLSKSEWKALRNKYLNLQRKYMKEMKLNLLTKRHTYSSIPAPAAPTNELEPVINPQDTEGIKPVVPLERIPGVFVKETLSEPCIDVRLTKRTVRSNVHALHVDVKEGQSELVIRFDSPEAANEYCANAGDAHVLCGAEEEEQWCRAESAREKRRPRGRARVLARHKALHETPTLAPASPQPTHTHIRFEDE